MLNLEERSSLLSLLELLSLSEYFVTVDHSVQWQRHIAWSKPNGEDLRKYVTQRYASNMVFLSCMLAAQINVFFNSSKELTDMRSLLGVESHGILRYWIGVCILLDISTTIIALVTTFTLWGMVSSISDANTHALLRSSIGQYVTSLPSKFSVAALYLFLLWITLFVADLVTGPVQACLLFLIFFMFFQVVIPLSAFGRLIIHTGAMATRPVLDKELEKELLPSGLHASLLIRATDRRRKYSNATDQYRKQNKKSRRGEDGTTNASAAASASLPSSHHPPSTQHPPENISFNVPRNDSDDLTEDGSAAVSIHDSEQIDGASGHPQRPVHGHRRMETFDTVGSDNFFFPGANVLNATLSQRDIHDVVQRSVRLSTLGGFGGVGNNTIPVPPPTGLVMENGVLQGNAAITPVSINNVPIIEEPSSNRVLPHPPVVERNNSNNARHQRNPSGGGGGGSGHRRVGSGSMFHTPTEKQSSAYPNPSLEGEPLLNNINKDTIMSSRIDELSPNILGRKTFHQESSPVGGRRETVNAHPLLKSPAGQGTRPPAPRPPKRNSKNRGSHSRSGSLLGLLPFASPLAEMEEENEVREMFDAPPAVNTEERLSREFDAIVTPKNHRSSSTMNSKNPLTPPPSMPVHHSHNNQHRRTNSYTSGTTPTIKEESTTPNSNTNENDVEEGDNRRRASSEPFFEVPEESTHLLADFNGADDNRMHHGYG